MAHWYYRGKTTAPVTIPNRGTVVITPRTRFEAPEAAVAHLKSLVVRLPDPPEKPVALQAITSSVPETPVQEAAPERRAVQEASLDEGPDPDHTSVVVESDPSESEFESDEFESESEEAEADQANDDPVQPAEKKKKQRRSRKGQP